MRTYLLLILLGLQSLISKANNIQLSNLATSFNSTSGVVTVDFDLSWENSWRTTAINNWDAAWVFFKYNDGGIWYHLDLTGFDITLPSGFTYSVPADKKGVFIYRDASNLGVGNVSLTGCKVGVQPQLGSFDLKAFALEMVYVPVGGFYVGDGATTGSYKDGQSSNPYYVFGGGQYVTLGTNSGLLNTGAGVQLQPHNNYPTGFYPYYTMKYELSTGALRDFLNCLTAAQQTWAFQNIGYNYSDSINKPAGTSVFPLTLQGQPNKPYPFKNFICIQNPGNLAQNQPAIFACNANGNGIFNEVDDGESIAIGGFTLHIYFMYLAFSALRPMTDLEFEKAARGPLYPQPGQYAWGNGNLIRSGNISLSNQYKQSESIAGGNLNGNIDTLFKRPLRNGIFATNNSSRVSAGASYYGIMELSGNLLEIVYNTSDSSITTYQGNHGNGSIPFTTIPTYPYYPFQGYPWSINERTFKVDNSNVDWTIREFITRGGGFCYDGNEMNVNNGKISFFRQAPSTNPNQIFGYLNSYGNSISDAYRSKTFYGIRGARTAE